MLEHDALRQILEGQAIAATNANSFACQISDEQFTPPDTGMYGEFWFKTTDAEQLELGPPTGFERSPGILQFTIYAPEMTGRGPPLKLAGALKHWFNRKQWLVDPDGYVTLRSASVKPIPGIRLGKRIVIVDCHFDFFYRNPTAT